MKGLAPSLRESILGPSYFYHRRIIERSKNWTASDIRQYQEKRYRALAKRYGAEVTQKSDYQRNLRHYTRWDAPMLTRTVLTGGTSGQPLRFKADILARRQKERAYLFDIWSTAGYQPHDLRVVFRGGSVHQKMLHFDALENAWIISPSATGERQLDALRTWILSLEPFFLHVYPSSLYTLIDLLGEDVFRAAPIRGILAGSEPFSAGERERLERVFSIQIAHWYGHSEYAALAHSCRQCAGFHFYPTYGYVELLQLPPETDGLAHIVATSFNRVGTQFMRYDTGDLADVGAGKCSSAFLRAANIVGRSHEFFVDRAGRKRSLLGHVFGIHGSFWGEIQDLQFVQEQAGALRVRAVPISGANTGLVERTLRRSLPMVELEFEYVPVIRRAANGKRRYLISALTGMAQPRD